MPNKHQDQALVAGQVKDPSGIWLEHAIKLVRWAQGQLLKSSEPLEYLWKRGIGPEAAKRYGLGLIPADAYRERAAWGLPVKRREDGKPKKLWIPAGIVIPHFDGGQLHRVRIRRWKGEPRYYWLEGSGTRTSCWPCSGSDLPGQAAVVVVETELDGVAVHAAAGDLVHVVALGSSSSRPKGLAFEILQSCDVVLFAGDFDQAGAKAWSWWRQNFSKVELWPVPAGKDPGDAVRDHGLGLREWVQAGLPPAWSIGADGTIGPSASCQDVQGAGKKDDKGAEGAPEAREGAKVVEAPAFAQKLRRDKPEVPEAVRRLGEILQAEPIVLIHGQDGKIGCYPKKKLNGRWVEDAMWWHEHPELGQELQELCWFDVAVEEYLSGHPDEKINRKNFWRGDAT